MKRAWTRVGALFLVLLLACPLAGRTATVAVPEPRPPEEIAPADERTMTIVAAARAFLATLDDRTRGSILFEYGDRAQRQSWSNLPLNLASRKGLLWGDMDRTQREAFRGLLGKVLSPRGVKMVEQQLVADEYLARNGRGRTRFGEDLYLVAFLGEPSETSSWMLQFGGHHLAINATVVGPHVTLAPSLTGGQPVRFEWEGNRISILADELTALSRLVDSLGEDQRKAVQVSTRRSGLVLGPGREGLTIRPSGLAGADLTAEQKVLLMDVVETRIGILNQDDAEPRLARIRADLERTHFAVFGDIDNLRGAYWRIVGPTLVLEYSPENLGGDPTQHIHSMMREPGNDYGAGWAPLE